MKLFTALLSGILFGLGLAVAQMTDPAKVLAFLDITRNWDPSLALVMGAALLINMPASRFILNQPRPFACSKFHVPLNRVIDRKLVTGSILFGIGWGLSGYCPGPIFTNLSTATSSIFWIFSSYLLGTVLVVKMPFLFSWVYTTSHVENMA